MAKMGVGGWGDIGIGEEGWGEEKKVMAEKEATNISASQPPERRPTDM